MIINFYGIMRSGIHSSIGWLIQNLNHKVFLYNNIKDSINYDDRLIKINDSRVESIKKYLNDNLNELNNDSIIIKSFESKKLNFNKKYKSCELNIIIIRNPIANLSSSIKYIQTNGTCKDIKKDINFDNLWLEYAKECNNETNFLLNKIVIIYDKFIQNDEYRINIFNLLNTKLKTQFILKYNNIPILKMGNGSSYNINNFNTNNLLNRDENNIDIIRIKKNPTVCKYLPIFFNNTNIYGILITTYKRKNNTSYSNLINISNFLKSQIYQNFMIYLIGDEYEDKEEFNKIINLFPSDKLVSLNTNFSFRKDYFNINRNKWTCGGQYAKYLFTKKMIEDGIKYYLHLDDDDIWKNDHINEINKIILNFPLVDFIVCKAKYGNGYLPKEYNNLDKLNLNYNNIEILPKNSVHSSWMINLNTFGKRLIELYEQRLKKIDDIKNKIKDEHLFKPFDAVTLENIQYLQSINKLNCIYSSKITVIKKNDCNIPV